MTDPIPPTDATIQGLRALKQVRPAWYWLQQNFSLPAVLTICGLAAAGGAFLVSQRIQILLLQKESQQQQKQIVNITRIVPDASMLASLKTQVANHETRLNQMEGDWGFARQHSADPPGTQKRPRKP